MQTIYMSGASGPSAMNWRRRRRTSSGQEIMAMMGFAEDEPDQTGGNVEIYGVRSWLGPAEPKPKVSWGWIAAGIVGVYFIAR